MVVRKEADVRLVFVTRRWAKLAARSDTVLAVVAVVWCSMFIDRPGVGRSWMGLLPLHCQPMREQGLGLKHLNHCVYITCSVCNKYNRLFWSQLGIYTGGGRRS